MTARGSNDTCILYVSEEAKVCVGKDGLSYKLTEVGRKDVLTKLEKARKIETPDQVTIIDDSIKNINNEERTTLKVPFSSVKLFGRFPSKDKDGESLVAVVLDHDFVIKSKFVDEFDLSAMFTNKNADRVESLLPKSIKKTDSMEDFAFEIGTQYEKALKKIGVKRVIRYSPEEFKEKLKTLH